MNKDNLSILVVGAGAVGGITAALLKKAGHNVSVAVRDESYATIITEEGIRISGHCGNHKVRIPAYASAEKIPVRMDLILLAVKNTELETAALAYKPLLNENGYFVTMQNGICEDRLAAAIGGNMIIGCVTGWGATMESHGNLAMTSPGDFIIGYPRREPDAFLKETAKVLSSVVPVKTTGNIHGHKYSKLIINSCITSLGAVCGLYLGEMLSMKKARDLFIEIIREAIAVAGKMNIKVEVFAGRIDFSEFIRDKGFIADMKRHLMIRLIGFKYRKLKSSSLQSLERGQPTEIDSLNGYIVRNGKALGVGVPVNEAIVNIIHQIERGERKISPDNFNEEALKCKKN